MESAQQFLELLLQNSTNTTSPLTGSNESPGLFSILFSFSTAFGDVVKLGILGGIIELARRVWATAWAWLLASFFISAQFDGDDEVYEWMILWLSRQQKWFVIYNELVCRKSVSQCFFYWLSTRSLVSQDQVQRNANQHSELPDHGSVFTARFQPCEGYRRRRRPHEQWSRSEGCVSAVMGYVMNKIATDNCPHPHQSSSLSSRRLAPYPLVQGTYDPNLSRPTPYARDWNRGDVVIKVRVLYPDEKTTY